MYKIGRKTTSHLKFWLLIGLGVLVLSVGTVAVLRGWYNYNLQPASSSTATQYFTIEAGSSLHQIAVKLEREGLIRSSGVFKTYVRSKELHNDLQAGTYSLSPSMSVQQIVTRLVGGDVAKNLLTILPAKRLDEIKQAFEKEGYGRDEVNAAFNASTYRGHPALESLPPGSNSLEGYLYPESFQKETGTRAEVIIRQSLDEMDKKLTPKLKADLASQGLNLYQALTLASIVLQETDDPAIQPMVAQVFLLRLKRDMLLQTDPTVDYAAVVAGVPKDYSLDSPYNTYKRKGLPPTPIGNVNIEALRAVAYPEKTDYLFFVTGDDGKFHFNHTQEAHEADIREFCKKNCG